MKIAIIAAMEREVRPLIRGWKSRTFEHDGRRYRLFEDGDTALVCGGIGALAARRATEAVIEEVSPTKVLSVGFAGALDDSLRVGDVFQPRLVINASDGARTDIAGGKGSLVTSASIAGKEQKARLHKAYDAWAVDMEAAAVAQGANARGVGFAAIKAISDGRDFSLPAMDNFIGNDGRFRSIHFACHVVLRPWLWTKTIALARNSARASDALCGAIVQYLERDLAAEGRPEESDQERVEASCAPARTRAGT